MMTRSRLCVLSLIALSVCPVVLAEADFLPADALREAGLTKYWQLRLPLEVDQQLQQAYLVDDTLYLGTQDGYVYAVDALTGVLRWTQPITRSGYVVRRPCHLGDTTIFATPTDFQVYDRRSGEPRARHTLRFPAATGPVADEQRFYIGGLDARVYAFNAADYMIDWKLYVGAPVQTAPALFGEHIYVVNENGHISAATRAKKAFYWQSAALGPVVAEPLADEKGVYIACRDQSLYLFDLGFGQIFWRARFAGPLFEAPYVAGDLAYQYCPVEGLAAVETATTADIEERIRWRVPQGRRALTTDEKNVYVLSIGGELLAVRSRDGQVLHSVPTGGLAIGVPAKDATVFLASADGRVFCARPNGAPPLKPADVLNALRPSGAPTSDVPITTRQPTTRPSATLEDWLKSRRTGPPTGGKSKVSRGFEKGEKSEPEKQP